MTESFRHLHYPGDLTGSIDPDQLLGHPFGRPYKVLEVTFDGERTTVVLAYASPDDVRRWNLALRVAGAVAVLFLGLLAFLAPTDLPAVGVAEPVPPAQGATSHPELSRTPRSSHTDTAAGSRRLLSERRRPAPTPASRSTVRPALPDPPPAARGGTPTAAQWAELRQCEASGDYTLHDPPYYGAYQFDLETWASVGGDGDPAGAPPSEQDARALTLWRDRGWQPWPVCGYAKWGARGVPG